MSQYDALWEYIKKQNQKEMRLTFMEIENMIHTPINHSFLTYKKELIPYGYQVKKISLKEKWILFEKIAQENLLLQNIDRIHTTELGKIRIQRNAQFNENEDVISWCKNIILNQKAEIKKEGKNWYVTLFPYEITINSCSYTIITVHKIH